MEQSIHTVAQLEAVIFSEGGEMQVKKICDVLSISAEELASRVQEYNESGRGVVLVIDGKVVLMRVAGEHAPLVEQLRKSAQSEDISKAGLEVLAIVLYSEAGSMSASEVEHIRGVNSGYTLRQLTMRGLLGKARKGMGYQYAPTAELLSFLGVTSRDALPEITEVRQKVHTFMAGAEGGDNTEDQDEKV